MPQTREQNESYFTLRHDFANKRKMRRVRELGVDAMTAVSWRAGMVDMATSTSVFGEISVDVRNFLRALGGQPECTPEHDAELALTWRRFESAKLVEIIEGAPESYDSLLGLPEEFRARIDTEGNSPRKPAKTGAQRTAEYKNRKRAGEVTKGDGASSPVTGSVSGDAGVTSDAKPANQLTSQPANQPTKENKVSKGLSDPSARGAQGLTFTTWDLDDSTDYEISRLVSKLHDADDGTRGVLEYLASLGADGSDFADARQALDACTAIRPSAYVVKLIKNRLDSRGVA